MNDPNISKITAAQIHMAQLSEELGRDLLPDEVQDQIDQLNVTLDARYGIVAGDGNYYPRRGFPE